MMKYISNGEYNQIIRDFVLSFSESVKLKCCERMRMKKCCERMRMKKGCAESL